MFLKILLLSHKFHPDIGGIETISEFLANQFVKAGYEVRVLTWTSEMGTKEFPFKVIRNPNILTLFREYSWANFVFENNPCLRLAWPTILFNYPTIIGLHTWITRMDGKIAWQDRFKFRWLKRAKQVVACSEAIRKKCWPDAMVIGNPYQEEIFRILPDVSRSNNFVFLGRLVSDKGADLAIQAFHQLLIKDSKYKEVSPNTTLTIIGDGPDRKSLKKLAFELGLKSKVNFIGALRGEELVKCLNEHKFLLVPSVWEEPFGIVVLEGIACGCIPIVSNGGGLPDAVGSAGLTFQRGNVDALVHCITKVLNNSELRDELLRLAPIHLEAHKPSVIANKYLEILETAFLK